MKINWSSKWWGFLISFGMVIVATVAGKLLEISPLFNPHNTAMLYILCVAISAILLGTGPSLFASFLSALLLDFLFIPPVFSVTISSEQDATSVIIMLAVNITISCLSPRIR